LSFSEEELPVIHDGRDPQVDLVRRYARILRSAPAEALRAQKHEIPARASVSRMPVPGTAIPSTARAQRRTSRGASA
jgi:hypothetical protein